MRFHPVPEGDRPLVVKPKTSIVIVKDREPGIPVPRGQHHVFRSLVHHRVQLRDHVIEQEEVLVEITLVLLFELDRVVSGGSYPVCQTFQVYRDLSPRVLVIQSVIIRVARLEIVQPFRVAVSVFFHEIRFLEKHTVGSVILHLPALGRAGEPERGLRGLVVIEIVLAKKRTWTACRLPVEYRDREPVYRCSNSFIGYLRRGQESKTFQQIIYNPRHTRVMRAGTLREIGFLAKSVHGDRIVS